MFDAFGNVYYTVEYEDGTGASLGGALAGNGCLVPSTENPALPGIAVDYRTITDSQRGFVIHGEDGEFEVRPMDPNTGQVFPVAVLGRDKILASETRSSLDDVGFYTGLMDMHGEWLPGHPQKNTDISGGVEFLYPNPSWTKFADCGGGYFLAAEYGNKSLEPYGSGTILIDTNSNRLSYLSDTLFTQKLAKLHHGSILVTHEGALSYLDPTTGSFSAVPNVEGSVLDASDDFIVTRLEDTLKCYTYGGDPIWTFDRYAVMTEYSVPNIHNGSVVFEVANRDSAGLLPT